MKAELRQKWLDALRGARYKQGTRFLRRRDEYCALGVLCAESGVIEFKPGKSANPDFAGVYECDSTIDDLGASSYMTRNWITEEQYSQIVVMNDNGASFAEIADWIEANVPATP